MSWSFNPPPGWPLPSGDWTPAPGWEPDPEWPPAPPGWEFWIYTPEPASELPPEPPARAYPASPYPGRRAGRSRWLWAVAAAVLLTCSGGTVALTLDRTPPRDEHTGSPITAAERPGWESCRLQPGTCNTGAAVLGGALVWGAPAYVPSWNLFETTDTTLTQLLSGVLPATGRFLPDGTWQWNLDLLAEEPVRVSGDPETYQYRIRPDAQWSDGTEITADDFRFAWKHNSRDNDLCDDCPSVQPGYERIRAVSGRDRGKTVTVTFRERHPAWFTLFTGLYPAHIAARRGFDLDTPEGMKEASTWFGSAPPDWSGGPWRIADVSPGTSATLEPNDEWYGPPGPILDRIAFRFLPGPQAMWRALANGEIDGFGPRLDPAPDDVIARPGLFSEVRSSAVWDHLDVNLDRPWTGDVAIREAAFTAIDIEEIVAVAYPVPAPGTAFRRNHLFPPGSPYYEDHLHRTGQGSGDTVAARAILDDAGYEVRDGAVTKDGGQVGPLVLTYFAENPRRELIAGQVAAALGRIGIEVEVRPGTSGIFDQRDYDLIIHGRATGPDFSDDGYTLWHSAGEGNLGGYADDGVDALVDQARFARNLDLAAELLNEAMRHLVDDAYVLPITATPEQLVVRDIFRNIRPNSYSAAGPFYNSHNWGVSAGG